MSGSVSRLKVVVEIVGREKVRELRKNKFFNDLRDKGEVGDMTIVLRFILVKRWFLRRGVTRAILKTWGKTPEDREELTRAVREGEGRDIPQAEG